VNSHFAQGDQPRAELARIVGQVERLVGNDQFRLDTIGNRGLFATDLEQSTRHHGQICHDHSRIDQRMESQRAADFDTVQTNIALHVVDNGDTLTDCDAVYGAWHAAKRP